MKKGYDLFVEQLDQAVIQYPSLGRIFLNGKEILKGFLEVRDKDGKHWDDYEIEIHSTEDFPYLFPRLFEVSNKIPKIADWHIYEDTFSCCVKILPEEILRCKKGITLSEYITEEVLPYLFNQTHRRVEGYYVNGEYAHGKIGIYQYYSSLLKTGDNIKTTISLMLYIANHYRPYRTNVCFCGNGKKFRHCHKDAFDKLKQLGDEILKSHAYEFAKAINII